MQQKKSDDNSIFCCYFINRIWSDVCSKVLLSNGHEKFLIF